MIIRKSGTLHTMARRLLCMLPLLMLAAGCRRDETKVYRVARDQDQASQQTAPALPTDSRPQSLPSGHPDISTMPGGLGSSGAAASPQPTWTTPSGWTENPPSDMRVGSFKIAGANGKQADVSIIPLAGMAGGDSANVNRWRGQVGLPVATDDELQKSAENVQAAGQSAQLYDLAGTDPGSGDKQRILGVIQHRDTVAWFYKMTGDADLVEQQKPAFIEFLKSLKFAAASSPAEMPAGHPAIGGDMMTTASVAGPISHEGQPTWQVPAGWQEVSGGQFLVAKFNLTGDGGTTAAVNVSSSPGDGGGLAANVNRWRGQLGLQPVMDVATMPVTIPTGKAVSVEMDGTNAQTGKPVKLIGVVVTQSGQTWFYKLMGDPTVVAAQKDAFVKFVQGAKY